MTAIAATCVAVVLLGGAREPWNPDPWLQDLAQIRTTIDRDYPNRDWLTGEREVSLDRWFDRAAGAIRAGRDDADARRALDALIDRFDDGHVALRWPETAPVSAAGPAALPTSAAAFCAERGYDAAQVTAGTAAALPGYRAIDGGGPFAAGLVASGDSMVADTTVGVVRIGVFGPQGYPGVCEAAVAATRTTVDRPCDAACEDRVTTAAYDRLTRGLMTTLERLRAAGAGVLLVDLTRNGGGSEWAEAAARIVSPVRLRSAPTRVVRSAAWVRRWRDLAAALRRDGARGPRSDRAMVRDHARRADAIADGLMPCPDAACSRLASVGFGSGLVADAPAGRFDRKPWSSKVFSPAQYPYRDGVWQGPVIVLVDGETWSAAEEFAALLRDNDGGVVMGGRTGGAGCGRLYDTAPIILSNSKARLDLPNCARSRKDGSNEVSGIVPDVPTGVRWNDGAAYAGRLTAARLPAAIVQAKALASGVSR